MRSQCGNRRQHHCDSLAKLTDSSERTRLESQFDDSTVTLTFPMFGDYEGLATHTLDVRLRSWFEGVKHEFA